MPIPFNSIVFERCCTFNQNFCVKYNGKKCKIGDLELKNGESAVLTISEVEGYVKVVRSNYKDEIVYIATNQTDIDNTELKL